jgi:hypothetical protein
VSGRLRRVLAGASRDLARTCGIIVAWEQILMAAACPEEFAAFWQQFATSASSPHDGVACLPIAHPDVLDRPAAKGEALAQAGCKKDRAARTHLTEKPCRHPVLPAPMVVFRWPARRLPELGRQSRLAAGYADTGSNGNRRHPAGGCRSRKSDPRGSEGPGFSRGEGDFGS